MRWARPRKLPEIIDSGQDEAAAASSGTKGNYPSGRRMQYVVCNGDEGDPALMDHSLMEGDPTGLSGMVGRLGHWCQRRLHLRPAGIPLVQRLRQAAMMLRRNMLNDNILGSGLLPPSH